MQGPRTLIRILVGTALGLALAACAVLPTPDELPAIALEQPLLYRLEIALAVFYGALAVSTPAYSGVFLGRLPTEISTRGAKFATAAEQAVERDQATIRTLGRGVAELKVGLSEAQVEIDLLKNNEGDKT